MKPEMKAKPAMPVWLANYRPNADVLVADDDDLPTLASVDWQLGVTGDGCYRQQVRRYE